MIASPQDQPNGDVFVAKITAVESTGYGGIFAHGFQEQRHDPFSRGYVDMEVGRTGTTTVTPAFGINGETYAVGTYVFVRLRGWSDLTLNAPADPASSGLVYDILPLTSAATNSNGNVAAWTLNNASADSTSFISVVQPYRVTIDNNIGGYIKFASKWLISGGAGGIKLKMPDTTTLPISILAIARMYDTTGGYASPVLSWAGILQAPLPNNEFNTAQSTANAGFFEVEVHYTSSVGSGLLTLGPQFAPVNNAGSVLLVGTSAFRAKCAPFGTT